MTAQVKAIDGGRSGRNPPDGYELDKRLSVLESHVLNLATKADIAKVRADISGWMLVTVVSIIGTTVGAIFAVAQVFKQPPTQPAPSAAPITINMVPGVASQPILPPSAAKRP